MKNILVLRHAKSDHEHGILDFARPLNNRGKIDAPFMGKMIGKLGLTPDLVLSSGAKRARSTAIAVAEQCGYANEITYLDSFYNGNEEDIFRAVKELPDKYSSVLIVGHNPTLEDFIAKLTSNGSFSLELPTTGLAHITCGTEHWNKIEHGIGMLSSFVNPKLLQAIANNISE